MQYVMFADIFVRGVITGKSYEVLIKGLIGTWCF